MTNSMMMGGLDVDDVRLGDTQVSKVMRGDVQVWVAGPPPPIKLLGSFTALVDSVSAPTKQFVVPAGKTVPVGVLLVAACVVNGGWLSATMADNADDAGAANAYVRRSGNDWAQGTSCFGSMMVCKVTREIDEGDTITLTHSATSRNRGAAVFGWFNDILSDTTVDGDIQWSTASTPTWATGAQAVAATHPTLDLSMLIGTSATPPYEFNNHHKVGEAVTAVGSADRSVALGYKVSRAAGARSASGSCSNAIWGAGLIALDYTP